MSLVLKFEGDTRDLTAKQKKALKDVGINVKKLEKTTVSSSKKMSQSFTGVTRVLGGLGIALGAGLAFKGITKTIGLASDLTESMNKVKEVFESSADKVIRFSESAATSLGVSEQKALEMTGTVGNLLVAMGNTSAEASNMSTEIVQLAADLGSFNNVGTEEALIALRAALVGEAEPIRRFGADIRVARLEQIALEKGIKKSVVQTNAQVKAMLVMEAVFRDTFKAQGDFVRTSKDLANATKIAKAQFTDLVTELGSNLIPLATSAVVAFSSLIDIFTSSDFDKSIDRLKELGVDAELINQLKSQKALKERIQERVEAAKRLQNLEISITRIANEQFKIMGFGADLTARIRDREEEGLQTLIERAKQTRDTVGLEKEIANQLKLAKNLRLNALFSEIEQVGKSKESLQTMENIATVREGIAVKLSETVDLINTIGLTAKDILVTTEATVDATQKEFERRALTTGTMRDQVTLQGQIRGSQVDLIKGSEEILDRSLEIDTAFGSIANEGFKMAQALGQGAVFFEGMNKFADSLLETVKQIAQQMAGRAFAGLLGGAIGFVASGFNPLGAAAGFRIASGFQHGGSFKVPGPDTGVDDKIVSVPVRGGETVSFSPPGNETGVDNQNSGGNTFNLTFPGITRLDQFEIETKIIPMINMAVMGGHRLTASGLAGT